MENDLLKKLIKGEKITDEDLENELYYICDDVHGNCGSDCPMYGLKGSQDDREVSGCIYFKDGKKMLKRLKEKYGIRIL